MMNVFIYDGRFLGLLPQLLLSPVAAPGGESVVFLQEFLVDCSGVEPLTRLRGLLLAIYTVTAHIKFVA